MSDERELPTFEEFVGQLHLEESMNVNGNKNNEEDALVLKFRRILRNQQGGFERRLLEQLKLGLCGCCGKKGHWVKDSLLNSQNTIPHVSDFHNYPLVNKNHANIVFEENEVEVDNDVFEFENKIKNFELALATMNLENENISWILQAESTLQ